MAHLYLFKATLVSQNPAKCKISFDTLFGFAAVLRLFAGRFADICGSVLHSDFCTFSGVRVKSAALNVIYPHQFAISR